MVTGLVTEFVIGRFTERSTSRPFPATRFIASQAAGGPATLLIAGMGTGMISTAGPVLAVCGGIVVAFSAGSGGHPRDLSHGHYAVAIAAVGMLSTLGITLATDAYSLIADNAGGKAERSGLGPEVRWQFREMAGILEGKAEPDYARCVQIATAGSQQEMVLPSLLAGAAPVATGIVLGVPGVLGLLVGLLATGFGMAVFLANAGGAWDNGKNSLRKAIMAAKARWRTKPR